MPRFRLLHADASGVSAHLWHTDPWHGKALRDEGRFAPDAHGHAAFAAYLRRHRGSVFFLLADFAEEGFQYEVIPFVRGGDRVALVRRKLNQFFYGSFLAAALSLGREASGRRDERVLFAALTRPQMLEPWLTAMRTSEIQLGGVYSAPLLAPSLAKRIKITAPRCLLVSFGRAGIRQSFLEDGKLRFSRLSPLSGGATGEMARACTAETARLYQYLAGQRVVAQSSPLPVLILAERDHHEDFKSACASSDELDYHVIDLAATLRQCGLKPGGGPSSDRLFLHLLAQRPPAQQFAPAADRHLYRLAQARYVLKSVGALALMGCLLFAGRELYQTREAHRETLQLVAQAQSDAQHYAGILNRLPPMPTSLENLRALLARYGALEASTTTPEALLLRISRALDASPQIEVERVEWETTERPDDPSPSLRHGATLQTGGAQSGQFAVATIDGSLPRAEPDNPRAMLQAVRDFAGELQRDAALRVSVLRMPLDVESAKTLRSAGAIDAAAELPRFSVRVSHALGEAAQQ